MSDLVWQLLGLLEARISFRNITIILELVEIAPSQNPQSSKVSVRMHAFTWTLLERKKWKILFYKINISF